MINLHPIKPVYEQLELKAFPIAAYEKLYADESYRFIYESLESMGQRGRYSFIGARPFLIFKSKGPDITIQFGDDTHTVIGDPFTVLKGLTEQIRAMYTGLPFSGGAIGYVGYDAIRYFEDIPDTNPDPLNLPDLYLIFPSEIISFDHRMGTVHVITYSDRADWRRLQEIKLALSECTHDIPVAHNITRREVDTDFESNFTKVEFVDAVNKCKDYILAGDIFQIVLSRRFTFPLKKGGQGVVKISPLEKGARGLYKNGNSKTDEAQPPQSPFVKGEVTPDAIYKALRQTNPSPYMYFISFDGLAIAGSSPEILVQLQNGQVTTRPLAGTRPRGATIEEDQVTAAELLYDDKERAEHIMLVDLGRNDVGRVSEYGSVTVNELMAIERYSRVMHISSNVIGQLRHGLDAYDVLAATFPAGTVSGAPKIRAMEIIEELEPEKRGIYAGAIGYFGFSGNMDVCIAIRTMIMKDGMGYIQAGAGIVADSDPEKEYIETLNKAKAVMQAVELAQEFQTS